MKRLALVVLLLLVVSTEAAAAREGDHGAGSDVRVAGDCGPGAVSSLRLRTRDDGLEVRFSLRQVRGRGVWRITIVHENRVAVRATSRTTRGDDSFEVRRALSDLPGTDTVVVHAWGPRGIGCRAAVTLPESP